MCGEEIQIRMVGGNVGAREAIRNVLGTNLLKPLISYPCNPWLKLFLRFVSAGRRKQRACHGEFVRLTNGACVRPGAGEGIIDHDHDHDHDQEHEQEPERKLDCSKTRRPSAVATGRADAPEVRPCLEEPLLDYREAGELSAEHDLAGGF